MNSDMSDGISAKNAVRQSIFVFVGVVVVSDVSGVVGVVDVTAVVVVQWHFVVLHQALPDVEL